ncbi:glycoside hydrolase family 2 [Microbacterium sp. dk485]|uniref:glycoside hydrolase family 2 protein n=1 Tax=Microbacterium sp. dk485 TaxID=2560021 RepID=UPI0010749C08|nr:glycoside hydrolase family 2 TIM barrel-domain containing protein [Microbacterium sp. dk485]TFV81739.1 glycoside hydrolase family 2 [Microbacterium sp. dk485]
MPQNDVLPVSLARTDGGSYPRPQLVRGSWTDLSGTWGFAFDEDDLGVGLGWHREPAFDLDIVVPFPPESTASGVGVTEPRRIFWYRREVSAQEIAAAGHEDGRRLLLQFGAVDYRCSVWLNGELVGRHEGGQTPFGIDISSAVDDSRASQLLVVRVEDDPRDVTQPRGKQDWQDDPHAIYYHRTSGIWQPVWLESVPSIFVQTLHWRSDFTAATVTARIVLNDRPSTPTPISIDLVSDGTPLATVTTTATEREITVALPVAAIANGQGYHDLLWSPERPHLLDAVVRAGVDQVSSYLGLRSVEVDRGRFLLNGSPYYLRSVLSQGYWPQSHLAAPGADALRREVELIKELGFNAARIHQKFEDPRFLYWADRLGLVVWGEAPAAFAFGPTAVQRTISEWIAALERDYSHPSIVAWVPLNESWGVQEIRHDPQMVEFARSIAALTRAIDPTRPVVSNDGWEQVDTDIIAIHDYEWQADVIAARYADRPAIDRMLETLGPAGRRLVLAGDVDDKPVMLTEFGGVSYDTSQQAGAWGYSTASSPDDLAERMGAIFAGVHASGVLAGFCYTQLTDTLQETNGLLTADREPKFAAARIREIVTGRRG